MDKRLVVNEIMIAYVADLKELSELHKLEIKRQLEKDCEEIFKEKKISIFDFVSLDASFNLSIWNLSQFSFITVIIDPSSMLKGWWDPIGISSGPSFTVPETLNMFEF